MGAWEVLTGMVTFLMWEYNRGMVKVGKTGGTGWTGEEEGERGCMKPKILIVDDEPSICQALTFALEDSYHK